MTQILAYRDIISYNCRRRRLAVRRWCKSCPGSSDCFVSLSLIHDPKRHKDTLIKINGAKMNIANTQGQQLLTTEAVSIRKDVVSCLSITRPVGHCPYTGPSASCFFYSKPKNHHCSWITWNSSFHYILFRTKKTPNDAVTIQRQSQFTPKMKANFGVNWLWHCDVTSSYGVFFHEIKYNGMTGFMEFMLSSSPYPWASPGASSGASSGGNVESEQFPRLTCQWCQFNSLSQPP